MWLHILSLVFVYRIGFVAFFGAFMLVLTKGTRLLCEKKCFSCFVAVYSAERGAYASFYTLKWRKGIKYFGNSFNANYIHITGVISINRK